MKKAFAMTFFDRPTVVVARGLLGKYLVRRWRGRTLALMITEVEAYDGPCDKASHASRGLTLRNRPMFGRAGKFYVYFTYGMHWLANIVTGPHGYPAAVLLRAGIYKDPRTGKAEYVQGPARLTKFLRIGGAQNGMYTLKKNGLWFEDRGVKIPPSVIIARKRIGVDYAGPLWANKKYNFALRLPIFSSRPSSRASRRGTRTR